MADYKPGDRVLVNISAGIIPGATTAPDWQPGTIEEQMPNGLYRVLLDESISGRTAEKDAAPEHLRAMIR